VRGFQLPIPFVLCRVLADKTNIRCPKPGAHYRRMLLDRPAVQRVLREEGYNQDASSWLVSQKQVLMPEQARWTTNDGDKFMTGMTVVEDHNQRYVAEAGCISMLIRALVEDNIVHRGWPAVIFQTALECTSTKRSNPRRENLFHTE